MDFIKQIPVEFVNFIVVVAFSLLIGLEQRVHHPEVERKFLFGTDRTFTLIGILGYVLYIISPQNFSTFIFGGLGLLILFSIFYFFKINKTGDFGLTTVVIALLTYSLAPLIFTQNRVLVLSVFVSIIILTGIKKNLRLFAKKFDSKEFLTLAKFIILSGVILPLLPKTPLLSGYDISLYNIWIAVIAISGISYFSYILKKFIFPDSGLLLTAILGGLYSSTATTIILSKKSKEFAGKYEVAAGILIATSMMYIRLLILAWLFNIKIAGTLASSFMILALISAIIAWVFYQKNKDHPQQIFVENIDKNPLEINTALIFGFLFAFFSFLTHYIFIRYGQSGINILSILVGITDIDPFVLNLFQNGLKEFNIQQIYHAVLLATASNNFLKAVYAWIFGDVKIRKPVGIGFGIIILISIIFILI